MNRNKNSYEIKTSNLEEWEVNISRKIGYVYASKWNSNSNKLFKLLNAVWYNIQTSIPRQKFFSVAKRMKFQDRSFQNCTRKNDFGKFGILQFPPNEIAKIIARFPRIL